MDSVTFTDPIVIALSESIIFSKQWGKVDTAFSKAHGVVSYPTLILVKADGTELDRIVGFQPPESFIPSLFDIMQNRNTLDYYLTKLESYPDSFDIRNSVAQKYRYRGDNDNARMHFNYFLEKDPENSIGFSDDALLSLGKLESTAKNYDTAIGHFEMLIADYPDSELREEASIWIPYCLDRAERDTEALEMYEAFILEFPESEDIDWVNKQIKKLKEQ